MSKPNPIQLFKKAIEDEDVKVLARAFFVKDGKPVSLTPIQTEIVRDIAFAKHKRICINAMTRWGKSLSVTVGVCLYMLLHPNKRIALIAPQQAQTDILRNYLADLIVESNVLREMVDFTYSGVDRLKKEASKTRQTFKNGCEYRVFSAEGEANRLMGFGVNGIVVKDEACLINPKAEAKISRMLGDAPYETLLIELANPWTRDSRYYDDWTSGSFKCYHIGYEEALKEGRTTTEFIEEQRRSLTPIEFTVLYKSEFPDEAEDSIFSLSEIKRAINRDLDVFSGFEEQQAITLFPHKHTEAQVREARESLRQYRKIISCDVADKGMDETVIFWGHKKGDNYKIVGHYSEAKSENMEVAGRINKLINDFIGTSNAVINIDCIGVGAGVVSRVKEYVRDNNLKNIKVVAAHYGESPLNKERFLNMKAENYFKLKDLFGEDQISIPNIDKLTHQLLAMRWELTSAGKIRIIDPEEKSPDFSDSLVYFIWKDTKDFKFAFV